MTQLIYPELSYQIIGMAMEVHRVLGPGYLESVFQKALAHEMTLRLLPFEEFKRLPVNYKGIAVGDFEADFVVDEKIILELKAVTVFHPKRQQPKTKALGL